jgi:acyl-CoA reductase-like NAD-dependent aldehyde dehydrogenase
MIRPWRSKLQLIRFQSTETDEFGFREIFGPVLPIVPVSDLDEAIAIVNGK